MKVWAETREAPISAAEAVKKDERMLMFGVDSFVVFVRCVCITRNAVSL